MNYWVITDTHFGHTRMQELCYRPADADEQMLHNIGQYVKDDDILIHLGDFCIGRDQYWHDTVFKDTKYKKYLIKGNHDNKSMTWYSKRGWDCVASEITLNIFGLKILFSHRPVKDCIHFDLNIHGHLHNNGHERHQHCADKMTVTKHHLIYMEHEYRPFNLRKLVEKRIQDGTSIVKSDYAV